MKNIQEKMKKNRKQAGFTLIEVLLVVIIIGILAAVVVPKFAGRGKEAQVNACKASIANISTAINLYEVDNGAFPPSLQALVTKGNENNWKGPYLDKVPTDPWGHEMVYSPHDNGFDLKSLGPDGVDSADDIIK
jgi:general secretion pathway protein G